VIIKALAVQKQPFSARLSVISISMPHFGDRPRAVWSFVLTTKPPFTLRIISVSVGPGPENPIKKSDFPFNYFALSQIGDFES
jgi:hypothetical protein